MAYGTIPKDHGGPGEACLEGQGPEELRPEEAQSMANICLWGLRALRHGGP